MVSVRTLDPRDDPEWDRFVLSQPDGWLTHSSLWTRFLAHLSRRAVPRCIAGVRVGGGEYAGVLPLYEWRSPLGGRRLIAAPYATVAGPLTDGHTSAREILHHAIALTNDEGAKYAEVRSLGTADETETGFSVGERFAYHELSLEPEPDELMRTFHRSCVRQQLKKALAGPLTVRRGESLEDLSAFYRLHVETRRRVGLPPQPNSLFRAIWDVLRPGGNAVLYCARDLTAGDELVGGLLALRYGTRVSAEFACSDPDRWNLSPNHVLFWTCMTEARAEGFRVFDFGRTSPWNISLMDFKARWGTRVRALEHLRYPAAAESGTEPERRDRRLAYRVARRISPVLPTPALRFIGGVYFRNNA